MTDPAVIHNTITINTCDAQVQCKNNEKCKWGFRNIAISTLGVSALVFAAVYRKEISTFLGSFISLPNLSDLSSKVKSWQAYIFQNPNIEQAADQGLYTESAKQNFVFNMPMFQSGNYTEPSAKAASYFHEFIYNR